MAQYHEPYGKPSKLFEYCNKAILQGRSKFIFVCIEDSGGTVAFDVHTQDPESHLDMQQIRSWYYERQGYWRRLLPKKIKVVPVKIGVVDVDRFDKILVKTEKIDYLAEIALTERRIQEVCNTMDSKGTDCGPIHNGELHHGYGCDVYDEWGCRICPVMESYNLKRGLECLKRQKVQLSCYLNSRYASGSGKALEDAGFIQDYCICQALRWGDAYIETESKNGLLLQPEWDKPQFYWIILIAFLFSICVTGVSTGASHDWQTGLAAGGLVVALESFVAGVLAVYDKFQ